MKNVNEQRHFLALLRRPGDYVFIDTSKLDICGNYLISLEDIDTLTMKYTKEEIIASIKRANIADDTYLNGMLVIQDNQKHNPLPVIDKDFYGDFNVYSYLKEKLDDKNKISNIINKFSAIIKDERISKDFKEYLKSGNIEIALNILFDLPYLNIRKFIIYLVEERAKEQILEIEPELVRDKAA